ncbi:MAG: hypothetical protein ACXWAC_06180 [Usitatibacter sp.]
MNYDPKNPAFASLRVTQQEHELRELMAQFPLLSRTEISDAIARSGPMRADVEAELRRLSSVKR